MKTEIGSPVPAVRSAGGGDPFSHKGKTDPHQHRRPLLAPRSRASKLAECRHAPPAKPRLASLDQFRGYTVAGMFLVNFLAAYDAWVPPVLLHHHTYCSYADTIMPSFLFAVGFAMRLSFGRRVQADGLAAGYARMVRRIVGLFLVAFAIYVEGQVADNWHDLAALGPWNDVSPYLKRHWLDTLGQIALTSLWILPVIRAGVKVRILFAVVSAGLSVWLSHWFSYHWANTDPVGLDGGPLGFLSWAVPTILGTITCDAIVDAPARPPLLRLTLVAFLVMGDRIRPLVRHAAVRPFAGRLAATQSGRKGSRRRASQSQRKDRCRAQSALGAPGGREKTRRPDCRDSAGPTESQGCRIDVQARERRSRLERARPHHERSTRRNGSCPPSPPIRAS